MYQKAGVEAWRRQARQQAAPKLPLGHPRLEPAQAEHEVGELVALGEERADVVALVAADPECGDLIRGTGGFRKIRVARRGMGKSGGARVVYIWRSERFPVFLITVFPKNEKENLSMAERNALKKRADSIFETYGR